MKNTAFIAVFLFCACKYQQPSSCNTKYTIDIRSINASMAYTTLYHVNDDSIAVEFINEVEGGRDSILLKRPLIQAERTSLYNYLSTFDIDTLKTDYINQRVDDGDQKRITLQIGNKNKTVNISNFYQKEMVGLYDVINNVINDDRYKIKYRK